MAYERCDSLEAEFADGRLCAREFVRHLAKSELYKSRYFFKVSPYRGIELNFKHLLGRPPLNQREIISAVAIQSEKGFDGLIDSIVDSVDVEHNVDKDSDDLDDVMDVFTMFE